MRKADVQTPMEVVISVYQGHQTEGFAELVRLAFVLVERWYVAPGVHRIPITEDGLSATLFIPPGSRVCFLWVELRCMDSFGLMVWVIDVFIQQAALTYQSRGL